MSGRSLCAEYVAPLLHTRHLQNTFQSVLSNYLEHTISSVAKASK